MAKVRNQTVNKIRRGRIHSPKAVPWSYAAKSLFSEGFNEVLNLITGGKRPGGK